MRTIKRYKGVSLIEMLITIVIIAIVLLLAATTLTTLIRVSSISAGRAMARDETEFVIELIRRNIRNTHTEDVFIYNVSGRTFNEDTGKPENLGGVNGYAAPVADGSAGTEIHFRPSGYHRWICIGYFPTTSDATRGYVVKSSYSDNADPSLCLSGASSQYTQYGMVLNSSEVKVNLFSLVMYRVSESNIRILTEVEMEPVRALVAGKDFTAKYYKQALITSEKLTWE